MLTLNFYSLLRWQYGMCLSRCLGMLINSTTTRSSQTITLITHTRSSCAWSFHRSFSRLLPWRMTPHRLLYAPSQWVCHYFVEGETWSTRQRALCRLWGGIQQLSGVCFSICWTLLEVQPSRNLHSAALWSNIAQRYQSMHLHDSFSYTICCSPCTGNPWTGHPWSTSCLCYIKKCLRSVGSSKTWECPELSGKLAETLECWR